MAYRYFSTLFFALAISSAFATTRPTANNNNQAYPLLRLKLVLDAMNYDDIAIAFNSSATLAYSNQIDSRYLPGVNAPEGLSALSSDNVALSAYVVPLPAQAPIVIRLDVEAAKSGQFTFERTELDSIPKVYDIWLMDKYAKDSINLRTDTTYALSINKNDTASYGANRFQVIIRQDIAQTARLVGFDAVKEATGNQISWTTANEQSNTDFTVQRSIDGGTTFMGLDSLTSNGSGAYSFADKTPLEGTDTYRLKMQDMNGVITFSDMVSIGDAAPVAPPKISNLSIYPNPSNGLINLDIKDNNNTSGGGLQAQSVGSTRSLAAASLNGSSSYAIKIVDIKGAVVKSATSSSGSWQDNLSTLSPGTYIVQVIDNSKNTLVGKSTFIKL